MVQYRKLTPDRWTRERTFWVSKWWTWNYGSESQGDGWQALGDRPSSGTSGGHRRC